MPPRDEIITNDDLQIIQDQRAILSDMIIALEEKVAERPVNGAELTLAMRHLQDARMRLGVAMTISNGQNPWKN